MKRQTKIGVASWLAVVGMTIALSCCAGMTARENVLIPAMKMAWVGISSDIDVGISGMTVDDAIDVRYAQKAMAASLEAGSIVSIVAVDWILLHRAALFGISLRLTRDEIGPGVAESLRERLRVFTRALLKLEQNA